MGAIRDVFAVIGALWTAAAVVVAGAVVATRRREPGGFDDHVEAALAVTAEERRAG
jgi:hypothetical protein